MIVKQLGIVPKPGTVLTQQEAIDLTGIDSCFNKYPFCPRCMQKQIVSRDEYIEHVRHCAARMVFDRKSGLRPVFPEGAE
jgi:hypothetical protein